MCQMLFYVLLSLHIASSLHAESLPAQQIMTREERERIGYDKLTPAEKNAFDQWVGRWTQAVLEQSPSYRPGQNISLWVQSWPSHANPTKTEYSPEEIQQRQASNQIIDRVRKDGEYIDLKDGSSWHISPFFRYLTTTWKKNQTVEVKKGTNQLHPWVLHNISVGHAAEADMGSEPSPSGKKENEPPEYYEGAVALQSTTTLGDLLSLADGSQWKIAPTDMNKVKAWTPSDRIRVEPSKNLTYTYRLTNLDTGEEALANPRK